MNHSHTQHENIYIDVNEQKHEHEHHHAQARSNNTKWFTIKSTILVLLFLYFVAINIVKPGGWIQYTWHYGIWFTITSYVIFWEGRSYFKIYIQLFRRILNMDTLVGLGAHILYVYSIIMTTLNITGDMYSYDVMWEGAAILIVFTNIGHFIEEKINNSSLDVYNKLSALKNSKVLVMRGGKYVEVPTSHVNIGDVILVQRGNLVPLDGQAIRGGTYDLSNITGESKATFIEAGKIVISGSYNLEENVEILVTKLAKDSTINHIINKIEEVSSSRPPMQILADKVLKYFIPVVIGLGWITFLTWLTVGYIVGIHLPWLTNSSVTQDAIKAGVTVIAIACPCALGIATPLVYTVSAMLAAKHGMVINEAKALEEINNIKIVAFDKTGTITSSEMRVAKVHGDLDLLPVARSLEDNINHPIALAISKFENPSDSYHDKKAKVEQIKHLSHSGISGLWQGKEVSVKRYEGKEFDVNATNTNIALYIENKPVLVFELENVIKTQVKDVIKKLRKIGVESVMITGDNEEVANHIAQQVGITRVFANASPNRKAEIITFLQNEGKVAFVGDGFNDSIAVKQSNVSFAFDTGSDITNSLCDISITSGEFYEIYNFFRLGKINNAKVKISLTYAFAFNIIAIPIAFLALVQPWMGAAIMAISDVLVALNALLYKVVGQKRLKHYHEDGSQDICHEEK